MTNKQPITPASVVDTVPPFARVQIRTVFRRFDDATLLRVRAVFNDSDERNPDLNVDDIIDMTASICNMSRSQVISCLWDATRPEKPVTKEDV